MQKLFTIIAIAIAGNCFSQTTFSATGTGPTGTIQQYVVPPCVSAITIDASGAQGGNTNGGLGARMVGTVAVNAGDTIKIVVGQQGVVNNCGGGNASSGGGGGSFVWREMVSDTTLFVAAGGGGGGNMNWNNTACRLGLDADTLPDGVKGNGNLSANGGTGGQGGFGDAPSGTGSGGMGWLSDGQNSTWGGGCTGGLTYPLFTGGNGATSFGPGGEGGFGGGGGAVCGNGGGGGYSGGGGGEGSGCRAGGGGGGSYNIGTSQSNSVGAQTGNGLVIITPIGGLSLTTTITPNDTVCEGTQVTFSGNGADTYVWNNGVTDGVPFTATTSLSYTMVGTDTVGNCSDSVTVSLTVLPAPDATIGQTNTGLNYSFSNNETAGQTWQWNFGDGDTSLVQNPNHAYAIPGQYVVCLTVTDTNNCSSTVCDTINADYPVGVNTINDEKELKVYPNPAKEQVTVMLVSPQKVELYDPLGKVVFVSNSNNKVITIDVTEFSKGIYMIKSGKLSQKLIIE